MGPSEEKKVSYFGFRVWGIGDRVQKGSLRLTFTLTFTVPGGGSRTTN